MYFEENGSSHAGKYQQNKGVSYIKPNYLGCYDIFMFLLQSDSALHGRETAPNRVLLNIFKGLWTYFRLHQGVSTQRNQVMPLFDRIYGSRR